MPFGMVGRTGPEVRQVVGCGNRPREGVILGEDMGRPIVSNGDFAAYFCKNA